MNYYRQCKLRKGNTYQTSWIPEKYAKVGKYIKLAEGGKWENGWIVETVGDRLKEKALKERSQDYKNTRKVSDI